MISCEEAHSMDSLTQYLVDLLDNGFDLDRVGFTIRVHRYIDFTIRVHRYIDFTIRVHRYIDFTIRVHRYIDFTIRVHRYIDFIDLMENELTLVVN